MDKSEIVTKNRIKVVHLGYAHKYNDTRIFEKEAKSLKNINNLDVTIITSDKNSNTDITTLDGINIRIIPLIKTRFIRLLRYISDLKKIIIDMDAEIFHIHEFILLPLIPFIKKKGKKVIYDKHEDTFDDVYSKVKKKYGDFVGRRISNIVVNYELNCIKKSDGYIYVTPQHKIYNLDIPNYLIPNFPKIKEDLLTNCSCGGDEKFVIAYCGGIAPIWNIKEISDIIKKRDDVNLILAGTGNQAYIDSIKQDDKNKVIKYLGRVPFEKVAKIYRSSDAGIALLDNDLGEVIGEYGTLANTKLFEYMKSGLPVIFSDIPVWMDIYKEYKFGIPVNPKVENDIIEAILFLKSNVEARRSMGEAGIMAVYKKYNWESTEEEFLNLYRCIIERVNKNE